MSEAARFEPVPFQIVSDSRQLKAFADPIRNRIMHFLAEREATNPNLQRHSANRKRKSSTTFASCLMPG